jgi:hypothetical protein
MRFAADSLIVLDRTTNLLWHRDFGAKKTYAEATSFCSSLSLAGISGWRVPSSSELASIYFKGAGINGDCEVDRCCPSVDQAAFPKVPQESADFWTSSLSSDGNSRLYGDFTDGRTKPTDEGSSAFVRCVRDP